MSNLPSIQNLDFDQIKDSLKEFLRQNETFKDYDFDGSNLNILIEILSANTFYNMFYANMASNESFLDSAQLRKNVVDNAINIGYFPRSTITSRAIIDIDVTRPSGSSITSLTIPKFTKLRGGDALTNNTKIFSILSTITSDLVAGVFSFPGIEIVEGEFFTSTFTVQNNSEIKQRFEIPNVGVDITLTEVKVFNKEQSSFSIYNKVEDINDVKFDTKVFYTKEIDNEKHEIFFGDDILGKAPAQGEIIEIRYLVSSGVVGEKIKKFTMSGNFNSEISTSDIAITTIQESLGSKSIESIQSIKTRAPNFYTIQNRAVTDRDFIEIIKRDFNGIKAVKVWGGENETPIPQFGVVFISIEPEEGVIISEIKKSEILQHLIKQRNLISIELKLVDPVRLLVDVNINLNLNLNITNDSVSKIQSDILTALEDFKDVNLNEFNTPLRYISLSKTINESHPSIISNTVNYVLSTEIVPLFDSLSSYEISFSNEVENLTSSTFTYKGVDSRFVDNGLGVVQIEQVNIGNNTILNSNIGTIDYENGNVNIFETVIDFNSNYPSLSFQALPKNKDIFSSNNEIIILNNTTFS